MAWKEECQVVTSKGGGYEQNLTSQYIEFHFMVTLNINVVIFAFNKILLKGTLMG